MTTTTLGAATGPASGCCSEAGGRDAPDMSCGELAGAPIAGGVPGVNRNAGRLDLLTPPMWRAYGTAQGFYGTTPGTGGAGDGCRARHRSRHRAALPRGRG